MPRRAGLVSMIVLTAYLLSAATAPESCTTDNENDHIGPTGAQIGAAVAVIAGVTVGTIVLIHVHKSHHTVKGCVLTGPTGLEVEDASNQKIYALTGITANVKPGDLVRLHGSKEKPSKGDPNSIFVTEKIDKDYGPCKLRAPATSASAP